MRAPPPRPCSISSRRWAAARRICWSASACSPSTRSCGRSYCAGCLHADAFDSAAIAAFNGRNNPDHFFWGEIANQLGKGEQFRAFWTGGPKAPDEKDWLKLFEGDEPVLILLDEMPPYFHYLDTQKVGNGTVADIATRAFANLLTAAGKKKNVCVVVSDLAAAYDTGGKLINRALEDARAELGRQERSITPVDLAANEIYDILRKRLFTVAARQGRDRRHRRAPSAASSRRRPNPRRRNRGAEAIADEIAATYPFHPRLKNVIALFKENEQFKQTRGLIELVSRLLKSVWERKANDVFLIGPQHFDLSIPEVRDKLTEISGHARRHRQGSLGRAAVRPRASHRSRRPARKRRRRSARCCSPPASPPPSTR